MLQFTVTGQKLTRVDKFEPATDSKAYLQAGFTFSGDWSGATKTALFRDDVTGESHAAPLNSSGICTVPAEVLTRSDAVHYRTQGDHFHVSLRGDVGSKMITTNEVKVQLARSGYTEGETPAGTTPDAYSQFAANVAADAAAAAASAEAAVAAEQNVASLYANALKKTVTGETVTLLDVSPIEHELGVIVHGKNLFNKSRYTFEAGILMFDLSALVLGKQYVFTSSKPVTWFKISNFPGGYNSVVYINADGMTEIAFTMAKNENIPAGEKQYLILSVATNYSGNQVKDITELDGYDIQIEEGTTATAYEAPIDPTLVRLTCSGKVYAPAADGTVAGVKSQSPKQVLQTDTPGAIIRATYHRDLVKVIEALEAALNN